MMKGQVTISRVNSNQEDDYVRIELVDNASRSKCVEIKLSPETLGNILTGLSFQECEFEFRPELVGKTREHKTMFVPRPSLYRNDENSNQELDDILEPFEVDGWKARRSDARNHHNYVGKDVRAVRRFIKCCIDKSRHLAK